ncbi:hypothetical protein [Neptunicella marina]|uniref:Uncharacterized protein n=1 Tax=Neptunicella marina TaxID=2125989 RepID=A0A8J6IQK6_9ALTE|nr:hypothetical protein [Neptunicella marina]MBC3764624.1 hypothetical protein [Neptunicella marina]
MRDIQEEMLTGEIKSSKGFVSASKWLKVSLACLVVCAYFTDAAWLTDVIVFSVVLSLILPLVFFDVFIQKLLEYNTLKVQERQVFNAKEANEHFEKLYKKVGR